MWLCLRLETVFLPYLRAKDVLIIGADHSCRVAFYEFTKRTTPICASQRFENGIRLCQILHSERNTNSQSNLVSDLLRLYDWDARKKLQTANTHKTNRKT